MYNQVSNHISKEEYNNIKNMVLFGIDTQSSGDGQEQENFIGRTDTIMIVSINKNNKSIKLISIPRDTYVEIEGYGKNKINQAHAIGEAQLALKTINTNFGLNITDYVTIDFSGLINVINDIGGIELYITQKEKDWINGASKQAYKISGNNYSALTRYGNVTLDGEQAVAHSRNRRDGNDFDRTNRQRNVIEAIFKKISKLSIEETYNMIDILLKEVTTNLNIVNYAGVFSDIISNKSQYLSNIVSKQVPTSEYAEGTYIDGIYYFVPQNSEDLKIKMLDIIYRDSK